MLCSYSIVLFVFIQRRRQMHATGNWLLLAVCEGKALLFLQPVFENRYLLVYFEMGSFRIVVGPLFFRLC